MQSKGSSKASSLLRDISKQDTSFFDLWGVKPLRHSDQESILVLSGLLHSICMHLSTQKLCWKCSIKSPRHKRHDMPQVPVQISTKCCDPQTLPNSSHPITFPVLAAQPSHYPAANVLFFLNFSPNFHNRMGAGQPNPIAMNASRVLPHPSCKALYI